jgi:hypothetical protein
VDKVRVEEWKVSLCKRHYSSTHFTKYWVKRSHDISHGLVCWCMSTAPSSSFIVVFVNIEISKVTRFGHYKALWAAIVKSTKDQTQSLVATLFPHPFPKLAYFQTYMRWDWSRKQMTSLPIVTLGRVSWYQTTDADIAKGPLDYPMAQVDSFSISSFISPIIRDTLYRNPEWYVPTVWPSPEPRIVWKLLAWFHRWGLCEASGC